MPYPEFTGAESDCPKCTIGRLDVRYVLSTCVVISGAHSQPPWEDNVGQNRIEPDDNPHLCRRCASCGYWTDEATADAA